MEEKEIDINNEEQILKECSFDYFYNCEECSRELCMFYNDIFKQESNFNTRQAIIDLGRIAITLNQQDKRIKELEKKLDNARQKDIIIRQNCRQGYIKDLEEMNNLREENQQLKQQLAEKDEEYQSFKKIADENVNYLKNRILEETKNYNQDKISFALEQLEQLKKLCQEKFNWWENSEWEGDIYDKSDVSNAYFDIEANIDNKIEEIKKEMK